MIKLEIGSKKVNLISEIDKERKDKRNQVIE